MSERRASRVLCPRDEGSSLKASVFLVLDWRVYILKAGFELLDSLRLGFVDCDVGDVGLVGRFFSSETGL
jgi:hypothetical protein